MGLSHNQRSECGTSARMRGGEDGIYHCEIPDAFDIIQMVYIGVYTANTGEWYMDTSMLE